MEEWKKQKLEELQNVSPMLSTMHKYKMEQIFGKSWDELVKSYEEKQADA